MSNHRWVKEFTGAAIVCDKDGTILELNDRALAFNAEQGGSKLIGSNAVDCHSAATKEAARQLLETGSTHMGLIEMENGQQFITYYAPWFQDGEYTGLVELILEVPPQDSHLIQWPSSEK